MRKEEFKELTIKYMKEEGADEDFITQHLTDNEIAFAMNNNISSKDLAWGLVF